MTRIGAALVALALVLTPGPATAGDRAGRSPSGWELALARQPLPALDGWAADGPGTTGGAAAGAARTAVVTNRAELVRALGGDNATNRTDGTPKLIFVDGTVDGFSAADGHTLTCDDLADPGYTPAGYLAAYDPALWGRTTPSGPLEDARVRSVANRCTTGRWTSRTRPAWSPPPTTGSWAGTS
ncbi:hypothetical protein [Micromonospora zhanjiangensis]|uniref:Uncharacterized protein n=1 Tax=Micromonospora zhanjiangensis TaxID=1522057 RepID=A0ABV8KSR8_9ACTN